MKLNRSTDVFLTLTSLEKARLNKVVPVVAVVVPFSTLATVLRHGSRQLEGSIPVKRSS